MDANRLIRFTVAGWAFLLSLFLHFWIQRFDFMSALPSVSSPQSLPQAIAILVGGLVSGPIIGLVVSTFVYEFISYYRTGDTEFEVPGPPDEFERYLTALLKLLKSKSIRKSIVKIVPPDKLNSQLSSREWIEMTGKLKPFFNLLFHERASTTLIDYTTRRWTIYWMYANSIFAIVAGCLSAVCWSGDFCSRPFDPARFIVEVLLGLYILFGVRRMGETREDIREVAWLWLYLKAEEKTTSVESYDDYQNIRS